MISVKNNIQEQ